METVFIEVTDGSQFNYGKFLVGRFSLAEWNRKSQLPGAQYTRLLAARGWSANHLLVMDLQTGEGALFQPSADSRYDLETHRIWVCPLFEPFLEWLYGQDLEELEQLPSVVDLGDVPVSMHGYRRSGAKSQSQT